MSLFPRLFLSFNHRLFFPAYRFDDMAALRKQNRKKQTRLENDLGCLGIPLGHVRALTDDLDSDSDDSGDDTGNGNGNRAGTKSTGNGGKAKGGESKYDTSMHPPITPPQALPSMPMRAGDEASNRRLNSLRSGRVPLPLLVRCGAPIMPMPVIPFGGGGGGDGEGTMQQQQRRPRAPPPSPGDMVQSVLPCVVRVGIVEYRPGDRLRQSGQWLSIGTGFFADISDVSMAAAAAAAATAAAAADEGGGWGGDGGDNGDGGGGGSGGGDCESTSVRLLQAQGVDMSQLNDPLWIVTAAHLVFDPVTKKLYKGRDTRNITVLIGVFMGDDQPTRWCLQAEVVHNYPEGARNGGAPMNLWGDSTSKRRERRERRDRKEETNCVSEFLLCLIFFSLRILLSSLFPHPSLLRVCVSFSFSVFSPFLYPGRDVALLRVVGSVRAEGTLFAPRVTERASDLSFLPEGLPLCIPSYAAPVGYRPFPRLRMCLGRPRHADEIWLVGYVE